MADIIDIGFRVQGADQAAEQIKGITNETKKLEGEQKKAEVGVKSYAAQIKALRLELISLGERTKENATQYDNVASRIKDLSEKQEDLVIGTKKLDEQLSALPGPLGRIGNMFQNFEGIVKNVRGAKIALIKQFPILKNAIAATGIGALVIVFGLLVGAVIKAFNSFKPLQEAVGRLGVAFELVEKLVQPVINLIGTGLTKAVDFAAKSIAFLTGNLEEYNKEVSTKKATEELTKQLAQQSALYELDKDKFTQLQRDKRDAYEANLQRFREIDEQEELSNKDKNERKKASNALYFRDLKRAEQEEQKRKDENFRKEEDRQKKLKELSQEQIKLINASVATSLQRITERYNILQARIIEGLGNPENIQSIREQTEFWGKAVESTTTNVERLIKQLKFLEPPDPAFPKLTQAISDLENLLISSIAGAQDFKPAADALLQDLLKNNAQFISIVKEPLEIIIDDFNNIIALFKETGITSREEISEIIKSTIDFENATQKGSLKDRQIAYQNFLLGQEKFIENYIAKQGQAIEESYKKIIPKEKQITQEFQDEVKERIRAAALSAFALIRENLKVSESFRKEAKNINDLINKVIIPQSIKATETQANGLSGLDNIIRQNLDTYSDLVEELTKGQNLSFLSPGFLSDIKIIQDAFISLNKNYKITDETALLILTNILNRRQEADALIKKLDTEYLGGQYEQQILQLEQQKKIDEQLLKEKGIYNEKRTELDKIYDERRRRIDGNYNLFVLNSSAQILGNLGSLFGEQTAAYKGLKYFEAIITAISSSVQAYESALAYGGPAGPVIAPILAATTFATQQRQAMKILETPEPDFNTGGGGPGYTGGLLGREGGLVFGRTHEQGGVNAELEGGEFILNRRTMMIPGVADLALRLNNLDPNTTQTQSSSQVVKAYVLSGEITTAQKADKRIRDLSRL